MNKIYIQYFKTPYGELILGAFNQQLCLCDWRYRKMRNAIDDNMELTFNLKKSHILCNTDVCLCYLWYIISNTPPTP